MYFIFYLSANKSYETEMTNCFVLYLPMRENILKNIKKRLKSYFFVSFLLNKMKTVNLLYDQACAKV